MIFGCEDDEARMFERIGEALCMLREKQESLNPVEAGNGEQTEVESK